MSELDPILSREELAAILGDPKLRMERERLEVSASRRPRPFARALTVFAEEQSGLAATMHQRPIRFELIRGLSMPVADFAATLAREDRAFALRLSGMSGAGAIVIGRSLLFGWLTMSFGAPSNLDVPVPERPYTRIETRFLRRLVGELVLQLDRSLALPGRCEIAEVVEPELIPEFAAPRLFAAVFDVIGLGEPGRLRIAFPEAWIEGADRGAQVQKGETVRSEHLMDMPVEVTAEVGRVELTLRRVGRLKVGDEIPLEGDADQRILVRIAGKPRFKAVRGSAGARAAIQIVSE